jgi:hypothetical protein
MKMIAGACSRACLKRSRTRADSDDHLDKLGSAHREKRHSRLPGDRLREERLPGPRGADQQDPLRSSPAEARVLRRNLQEVDDLDQLVLGLVDPGDVVEGDLACSWSWRRRLALPIP